MTDSEFCTHTVGRLREWIPSAQQKIDLAYRLGLRLLLPGWILQAPVNNKRIID